MKGPHGIYVPKDLKDDQEWFDFEWGDDEAVPEGDDPPLRKRFHVNLLKKPKCDCGAEKAKTTHADWCSTRKVK